MTVNIGSADCKADDQRLRGKKAVIGLLLILDSLGTSELLVILVVALIFFGPRKLPQISRQIGKSLAEFRKASEDFKRTWEREVALETTPEAEDRSILGRDNSVIETTVERGQAIHDANIEEQSTAQVAGPREPASINGATSGISDSASAATTNESAQFEPTRKRDWL
jgi:Tat protein translocase TatB subunit